MQKTEHLDLNLFEDNDPVLAESFNRNTRILDETVAEKIGGMVFTYTGDGATTRTISFSRQPLFVIVGAADSGDDHMCFAMRGAARASYHTAGENYPGTVSVAWEGNDLTITGGGETIAIRAKKACNTTGRLYRCIAFTA